MPSNELLHLLDSEISQDRVELRAGETLFHQGDPGDGMYLVVSGLLEAVDVRSDDETVLLSTMTAGALIGEVQTISGGRRSATIRAAEDSELVRFAPEVCRDLLASSPNLSRELAEIARGRIRRSLLADVLPGVFGELDPEVFEFLESQAEWVRLSAGETLFERGDPSDRLFLVLGGRLAAIDEERLIREIGRGESLGETALFTGEARSLEVRALRDSTLVSFTRERFEEISARYPQVLFHVSQILIRRMAKSGPKTATEIRTIALLPADGDPKIVDWVQRLGSALRNHGSVFHLDRQGLQKHLDFDLDAAEHEEIVSTLLTQRLEDLEAEFRFVLYEAESSPSSWTRLCLRQADQILLIASARNPPSTDTVERFFSKADQDLRDRTTAVLLRESRRSRGTGRILSALGLARHHHVVVDDPADDARLARRLAGRAIGVALGGGGARGFAHVGVLRAFREAGVPVDMVGGTSMGSLIAAQYAYCGDPDEMLEMNRRAFLVGKPTRDVTLPVFGLLSGKYPEKLVEDMFDGADIEDFHLDYFAVSSNLASAAQKIHRSGSAATAIRASMSVPGAVNPAVVDGEMLVDGGVLNNLPGDVMRRLCGGRVVLVDVSPENDQEFVRPELPSPWRYLWSRLNPFARPLPAPTVMDILIRSGMLAGIQGGYRTKEQADLYLAPPIDQIALFDLHALEEIVEIGYVYTKKMLDDPAVANLWT